MKYTAWIGQWLENYVRPSVRVRTYERYKLIAERHIAEGVGGEELDALTPLVLQGFVAELLQSGNKKTGGGLSPNSVNAVISVIQSSLKTAHLLGLRRNMRRTRSSARNLRKSLWNASPSPSRRG